MTTSAVINAQNSNDSNKSEETTDNDTLKLDLRYSELEEELINKQANDEFEEQIKIYHEMAKINIDQKDFSSAIKNSTRAIRLAKDHNLTEIYNQRAHMDLSFALHGMGAYSESIKHKKLALSYHKDIGEIPYERFYLISKIGTSHLELLEFDSCMHYLKKAEQLAVQMDIPYHSTHILNNIGLTYLKMDQKENARIYFEKALESAKEEIDYSGEESLRVSLIKGNIADCLPLSDSRIELYLLNDIEIQHPKRKSWKCCN